MPEPIEYRSSTPRARWGAIDYVMAVIACLATMTLVERSYRIASLAWMNLQDPPGVSEVAAWRRGFMNSYSIDALFCLIILAACAFTFLARFPAFRDRLLRRDS